MTPGPRGHMLTRICIAYSRISITELAFRKTGPGVPVHRRKARAGREFLVSDVFHSWPRDGCILLRRRVCVHFHFDGK